MTNDLSRFLRARLDEEAALAHGASPGPWHVNDESDEVLAVDGVTVADGFALSGKQLRATAAHIARNDPPTILFEVDIKRQLADRAAQTRAWAVGESGAVAGPAVTLANDILRILALPYADHPDYQEGWKP